jgi:hypothetical protein
VREEEVAVAAGAAVLVSAAISVSLLSLPCLSALTCQYVPFLSLFYLFFVPPAFELGQFFVLFCCCCQRVVAGAAAVKCALSNA